MTNSYQDIEFGRFVYFFIRAGQFCTQKYWKRIGRKNTMIGINVPKVKNKIKVNIFWESQKKIFKNHLLVSLQTYEKSNVRVDDI